MAITSTGMANKPLQVKFVTDGPLFKDPPVELNWEIKNAVRLAASKMEQREGCDTLMAIPRFEDTVDLYKGTSTENDGTFVKLEAVGRLQQQRETAEAMSKRVLDKNLPTISLYA